jgi:uncharacterized protein (DUF2267 family)
MNGNDLIGVVRERAGLRTAREARRAVGAAIAALRCALDDADVPLVAAELPKDLVRVLEHTASKTVRNATALYIETERRERVGLGFAMEHAQVVLQVLAEHLDPELVSRLHRSLPSDIAALLRRRRFSAEPPPYVHQHPAHRDAPVQTLSRSHPGASETIAEARSELAHRASVARTSNPLADRMVASARSTRPGHEDETLATSHGDERRR